MTPIELLRTSDAAVILAGAACLVGWVAGLLFAVTIWWRPISRVRHDGRDWRLMRLQLEDSDRQLTAALAAANRMAAMVAEHARQGGGRAA